MLFAAPFFVLVGSGGSWWRRGWSAGLGAALPVIVLFAYNMVTAGNVLHPAYAFLYEAEATYYPTLGYHLDWAIEDPRYIPQNLGIMLFSLPLFSPDTWPDSLRVTTDAFCTEPGAARGLFDVSCPLAVPNDIGMSVLLTSPAYLLAIPALGRFGRADSSRARRSPSCSWRSSTSCTSARAGCSSATGSATISCRGPSSSWHSVPRQSSGGGRCRRRRRPRRRLDPRQRLGSRVGQSARMVRLLTIGLPIAVGLIAFALVARGLQPGLAFWDTAELQVVAPLMGTAHPTGFPTYVLLGWLASVLLQPFGEPAFRMNLFSAICVAVAAGVTVDLVRVLTRSRWIGAMAGLGLVLTPQVWAIGTHAEAHSLHLAFVAILLRLLVGWEDRRRAPTDDPRRERADRWLVAATVVFGGRQPFADAAPRTCHRGLRDRGRAGDRAPGTARRDVPRGTRRHPCRGVSRAAPAGRPVPRTARLRPDTWDGFRYIVLGEQFRGSVGTVRQP